jgi:hypothetical protein
LLQEAGEDEEGKLWGMRREYERPNEVCDVRDAGGGDHGEAAVVELLVTVLLLAHPHNKRSDPVLSIISCHTPLLVDTE